MKSKARIAFVATALILIILRGPFVLAWMACLIDPNVLDGLPLKYAAYKGSVFLTQEALSHKANVHVGGDAPLSMAAQTDHLDVLNLLLLNGADVHAGRDFPLFFAVQTQHPDIVKALLDNGAKVTGCEGAVILREAMNTRNVEIRALLEKQRAGQAIRCPDIKINE